MTPDEARKLIYPRNYFALTIWCLLGVGLCYLGYAIHRGMDPIDTPTAYSDELPIDSCILDGVAIECRAFSRKEGIIVVRSDLSDFGDGCIALGAYQGDEWALIFNEGQVRLGWRGLTVGEARCWGCYYLGAKWQPSYTLSNENGRASFQIEFDEGSDLIVRLKDEI
ncbi:MAG: hypothetical protein KDC26_02345 [Armatimonadetes bacterium]|nr:hypothetical protein [Armatimonadota bacterium]